MTPTHEEPRYTISHEHEEILTRRDLFAAMALQGLCVPVIPDSSNFNDTQECQHKAGMAVRLADALLAELEKGREG